MKLSGFDSFSELAPYPESNQHRAERLVGAGMPELLDANAVLSEPKLLAAIYNRFWYWRKGRAWFIDIKAPAAEALATARKVHKKLRARTKISASTPMLHDLALYVGSSDGIVVKV